MPIPRVYSPDLPPPPYVIAQLPLDARGYPIPFIIKPGPDGNADFAAGPTPSRWKECLKDRKCFLCGKRLGRDKFFLLDAAEAVARLVNSLPKHSECCLWEMTVNPFYRGCPQEAAKQFKVIGRTREFLVMGDTPPRVQPGEWKSLTFWLGNEPATREQCIEHLLGADDTAARDYFNRIGRDRKSHAREVLTESVRKVFDLLPKENTERSGA